MPDFVHLHVHTEHSPLDGLSRVADVIATAREQGSKAIATTDHGSLNSWYVMHKEARKTGGEVTPIYGEEAYFAIGSRFDPSDVYVDRDDDDVSEASPDQLKKSDGEADSAESTTPTKKRKSYYHLTLLARNATGFSNLLSLHNEAERSYRFHPLADFDLLDTYGEGLIVLTGCLGGPVAGPLSRGDALGVLEAEDDLWRGLEDGDAPRVESAAQRLVGFASTPDSTYEVDRKVREKLEAARKKAKGETREDVERKVAAVYKGLDDLAEANRSERTTRAHVLMAKVVSGGADARNAAEELVALAGHDNLTPARANIDRMEKAVGRGNVYVEVMDHGIGAEEKALEPLVILARQRNMTIVATNDCHYTLGTDHVPHDAWLCLSTGKQLRDTDRFRFNGSGYHIRTPREMYDLRPEEWWKEACANTVRVAERIEGDLMPEPHQRLPKFPLIPEGFESSEAYLHSLVRTGAVERYGYDPERPGKLSRDIVRRLKWEEEVISGAGVSDYFLILHDLDEWARSDRGIPEMRKSELDRRMAEGETFDEQEAYDLIHGRPGEKKPIRVGPGRGSAAGSCFAYVLHMTQLDPLANGLLFERFLNPERVGLPDVDTDFEKERRAEILAYLVAVYGSDMVARVGTFGMSRSKSAIKDAARVLDLASLGERMAADVPVHQGKAARLGAITDDPGPDAPESDRNAYSLGKGFREKVESSRPFAPMVVAAAKGIQSRDRNISNEDALEHSAELFGLESLGERLCDSIRGETEKIYSLDMSDSAFQAAQKEGVSEGEMILGIASRMEKAVRNNGIHACATLISDEPMENLVPLRYDRSRQASPNAPRIVGWEGGDVDEYGLLKLDVLGLITLDMLSLTLDYIRETTGEIVDTDKIVPGDRSTPELAERDDNTFRLIGEGRTSAVFQLASSGMRDLASAVQPSDLNDLTALVALYRPGPMGAGMHTMYADRRNGRERVSYDYLTRDPSEQEVLAGVLGETYGVVVYQEQLMRVGTAVGGLDAAWTNKLRKAFSKKKKDLMDAVKDVFYKGALGGDNPSGLVFKESTLDAIWSTFEASAEYLFNKSHAACYGLLAYWTAYLKANWPVQFSSAALALTQNKDKRRDLLRTLESEGVPVLAPDVNHSQFRTAPDGDAVRFGLSEVKNVGKAAALIVEERDQNGPYRSLADLMRRVNSNAGRKGRDTSLTTANIENLIEAGAFDSFGTRAGQYTVSRVAAEIPQEQIPDFEWGAFEKDRRQRDKLGLTLGTHPVDIRRSDIARITSKRFPRPTKGWTNAQRFARADDRERVSCIGLLTRFERRMGRKSAYALIELEFSDRQVVSGIMFSRGLDDMDERGNHPVVGMPALVSGTVRVKVYEREVTDESGETSIEQSTVKELFVDRVNNIPDLDDDMIGGMDRRIVNDPSRATVGETPLDIDPSSPAFFDVDPRTQEGNWVYGDPRTPAFVGPDASSAMFDWACGEDVPADHAWHAV